MMPFAFRQHESEVFSGHKAVMSLFRYQSPRDYFYTSPMERFLVNALDNAFSDLSYRPLHSVAPYWLNQPVLNECNIGNSVGKARFTIINEKDKFAVEVDVAQFQPKDLSVSVRDGQLVIEGHHEERNDQSGSIERHFIRKYALPKEVSPDAIESHLSDSGVLTVMAKKAAIDAPQTRSIPIRAAPKEPLPGVEQNKNASAPGTQKK
ncbi:unnamed protein product [Gongylonema pulchrum]|uniref:SHSP domain-containing protein n=1 Tax=Gongylonema pulchrum TaxID=637853 RepID=A0A183EJ83_9BILA|nr:unnamed protein product [Gongylonema pulchrum]